MKITCLGTGSPESTPRRASSGYLVETGDDVILLDCGGGVVDRLIQSSRRPSDVTHLFFSHLHSDHMMDYARLIHAAWDEGGRPLKVFGPAPINKITQRLFGPEGAFAHDLTARTENPGSQEVWQARGGTLPRPWPSPEIVEIEPGFSFDGNDWALTSCSVPHAQPHLVCMAFRIDAHDKSVVYSGDAALCETLAMMARDCDLLLHWCYRLHGDESHPYVRAMSPDPVEIAQLAERVGIKRPLLTHLRSAFDTDDINTTIRRQISEHFHGDSGIAEDLMVIDL